MNFWKPFHLGMLLLGCVSLTLAGCGGGGGGGGGGLAGGPGPGQATATILFDGGLDSGAPAFGSMVRAGSASEVDPADIQSLTLTLTEIVFLHEGGDGEPDEEEDDYGRVRVEATEFSPEHDDD